MLTVTPAWIRTCRAPQPLCTSFVRYLYPSGEFKIASLRYSPLRSDSQPSSQSCRPPEMQSSPNELLADDVGDGAGAIVPRLPLAAAVHDAASPPSTMRPPMASRTRSSEARYQARRNAPEVVLKQAAISIRRRQVVSTHLRHCSPMLSRVGFRSGLNPCAPTGGVSQRVAPSLPEPCRLVYLSRYWGFEVPEDIIATKTVASGAFKELCTSHRPRRFACHCTS